MMEAQEQDFRLSVVLLLPHNPSHAIRSIRHLRQQDFEGIQLVLLRRLEQDISCLNGELLNMSVKVVSVSPHLTSAEAWAEGFRSADAPLVGIAEDHSFVAPGWAQAIWEAHQDSWRAVGPRVRNANPETRLSWADLALSFMEQVYSEPGPAVPLMGHNCFYKKAEMFQCVGSGLVEALESEAALHSEWGAEVCFHQPKAVVEHVNHSRWWSFLTHKILGGIVFAALRGSRWPAWKRAVYAVGAPLIPLVRARRIAAFLSRMDEEERRPFVLSWAFIGIGLAIHAAGECLGYICGPTLVNRVYQTYSLAETNRWETVREEERVLCR
jgi:hypothetical protein